VNDVERMEKLDRTQ